MSIWSTELGRGRLSRLSSDRLLFFLEVVTLFFLFEIANYLGKESTHNKSTGGIVGSLVI